LIQYTLAELSSRLDVRVVGDKSTVITNAAVIGAAEAGDITFARDATNLSQLSACPASAVIIPTGCTLSELPFLLAEDPTRAFVEVVKLFRPAPPQYAAGISPTAQVHPSVRLDETVSVQAGAVIGADVELGPGTQVHGGVHILEGTRIGSDCVVYPNVTIYEHTVIGDRVIIHAGSVLGSFGFGYDFVDGSYQLGHQLGNVVVEDDVEIGACSVIDRGAFGPTLVGEGTKLDNQVQIAHNCRIGRHNIICAQVGIAGTATTGDFVVIGGQVGIRDHIQVCDRARVGAQSGVMQDITEPTTHLGTPTRPEPQQMKIFAALRHLPELRKQVRGMQRLLDEMQERLDGGQDGIASEDAA
jgi:UDP-3-O-[3-hydroxymyristoyl] glucosamine N-acyltransferase